MSGDRKGDRAVVAHFAALIPGCVDAYRPGPASAAAGAGPDLVDLASYNWDRARVEWDERGVLVEVRREPWQYGAAVTRLLAWKLRQAWAVAS